MHALPTAVFLDRDGTIIHDTHYLSDPGELRLLDGAADAIARLNRERIPVILVTNQSGIGRGYFTVAQYEQVHARLAELLARHGAHLDASYYCPHDPDHLPHCSCRKPAPFLFRRAMEAYHLDPAGAVAFGDRWRDIAPILDMGGRGILIPSPNTPAPEIARAHRDAAIIGSLAEGVSHVLAEHPDPHTGGGRAPHSEVH